MNSFNCTDEDISFRLEITPDNCVSNLMTSEDCYIPTRFRWLFRDDSFVLSPQFITRDYSEPTTVHMCVNDFDPSGCYTFRIKSYVNYNDVGWGGGYKLYYGENNLIKQNHGVLFDDTENICISQNQPTMAPSQDDTISLNFIFIIFIFIFGIGLWCSLRNIHRRQQHSGRGEPSERAATIQTVNDEEKQNDRRLKILTNIIHKKVLHSKSKNDNNHEEKDITVILPHEKVLSSRALKNHKEDIDDDKSEDRSNDISSSTIIPIPFSPPQSKNKDKRNLLKSNIFVESARSLLKAMDISESNISSIYSPKTCPICIDNYKVDDEIAWSRNDDCYHAFHLECILGWLMEHDECPLCRGDYLCIECGEV